MNKDDIGYYTRSIIRSFQNNMDKKLYSYDINGADIYIIEHVYNEDGISQEKLSSMMIIDRTTISRRIKRLETLGYIKKVRDDKDRRAFRLHKTEKGLPVYEKIKETKDEFGRIGLKGVSEKEQEMIKAITKKIYENIKDGLL
ncbi:MarR family transcriptional regulator [Wukongibacter baidiensis]|uniref:MarR family winged helix-turn-helix transcriptional regulator n=1 Tax=Wukongibacter baidiensis TaxID=1723361 RepID=UPI003D7FEC58